MWHNNLHRQQKAWLSELGGEVRTVDSGAETEKVRKGVGEEEHGQVSCFTQEKEREFRRRLREQELWRESEGFQC